LKGQTTVEFMAILLVLVAYLAVVFSVFSTTRNALEQAVDRKLEQRLSRWVEFIAARPEGTQVRLDLTPYPGRYLGVSCGEVTRLTYPSGGSTLEIPTSCVPANITENTCLSVESTSGGARIEVC
jgi:hypothetical protein